MKQTEAPRESQTFSHELSQVTDPAGCRLRIEGRVSSHVNEKVAAPLIAQSTRDDGLGWKQGRAVGIDGCPATTAPRLPCDIRGP